MVDAVAYKATARTDITFSRIFTKQCDALNLPVDALV